MALQQDFENRRRERLRRQRKQRQRMRIIRLVVLLILLILVIIAVAAGISRCAGNSANTDGGGAVVTQIPMETSSPAPAVSAAPVSAIPAPEAGDNNLLDRIADSGQKKHVYLTFDDGPNDTVTPQILDILRKYNVKATFFMVGRYIAVSYTHLMCIRDR